MAKSMLLVDVYTEGLRRIESLYKKCHRVVVSFSGGKDSTVLLHLAKEAARNTGNLPVEVIFCDAEIAWPGTFEYIEDVSDDPEVDFYWVMQGGSTSNCYNRECPLFWPFDERYEDVWMRRPDEQAYWIAELSFSGLVHPVRFPPREGKKLVYLTGIRVEESIMRRRSIASSGSFLTRHPNDWGAYAARPLYDWTSGDVWKFIADNNIPYNTAYDTMVRGGLSRRDMRVSSTPALSVQQIPCLQIFRRSHPTWFAKACARLPGLKLAALYGSRAMAVEPNKGETYKQCFFRHLNGERTPAWVVQQSTVGLKTLLGAHKVHSSAADFGDTDACQSCAVSWKTMVSKMYVVNGFGTAGDWNSAQFRPNYYHPQYPGIKLDPKYDPEGIYYDENGRIIFDVLEEEKQALKPVKKKSKEKKVGVGVE